MREYAYVTPEELYDAGVLNRDKVDEDAAWLMILDAQATVELVTRQWFNSRMLEIVIDGADSAVMFFGVPIIEINEMYLNEDEVPQPVENYIVHNSITWPDDRRNPRVEIKRQRRNIFVGTSAGLFLKGYQQKFIGRFGYIELDGTTPVPIIKAMYRLVANTASDGFGGTGGSNAAGPIKQEITDGHSITYATAAGSSFNRPDSTGDQDVDRILGRYRSPLLIGAPRNKWPDQILYTRYPW